MGTLAHYINGLCHVEPYASFIYAGVYAVLLIFVSPLFGIALILDTVRKTISHYFWMTKTGQTKKNERISSKWKLLRNNKENSKEEEKEKVELCVYITGCDEGFGKLIAFELMNRGYFVFAGCLTEKGMKQYYDDESHSDTHKEKKKKNVQPLLVDVTKDEDMQVVRDSIEQWCSQQNSKRYLHCVINNAGIESGLLVDLTNMSVYDKVMDVNFLGIIRTVKATLPILKRQVCDNDNNRYTHGRIINIVSMAGLTTMPTQSPYFASKHAADAFTKCLFMELKQTHNIPVVCINPSFHKTSMVSSCQERFYKAWEALDNKPLKDEYGDAFFEHYMEMPNLALSFAWDASNVTDVVVNDGVESLNPPPRILVGSDSRLGMLLFARFPTYLREFFNLLCFTHKTPQAMMK